MNIGSSLTNIIINALYACQPQKSFINVSLTSYGTAGKPEVSPHTGYAWGN